MATHSSILAWEISGTEEPGGLQSRGVAKSQTWLNMNTHTHTTVYNVGYFILSLWMKTWTDLHNLPGHSQMLKRLLIIFRQWHCCFCIKIPRPKSYWDNSVVSPLATLSLFQTWGAAGGGKVEKSNVWSKLKTGIFLYEDCHKPLQLLTFNTPWKEFRVQIRNEALCTLGKLGRTGLKTVRCFQEEIFMSPRFCISSSRKALKIISLTSIPCD